MTPGRERGYTGPMRKFRAFHMPDLAILRDLGQKAACPERP